MGTVLSWIFGLLTQWYIWMPIVGVLVYFTWRNHKRAEHMEEVEHILLTLEIPRTNDKQELAAEQLFASLHGILRDKQELRMSGGMQEHISFEIAAIGKLIRFYVWVPKHLQNFVEGQIYAQYPTVQIREAEEDYTRRQFEHSTIHTAELGMTDNEMLPIKSFQNFEVDPLAGITATLAKLEESSEEIWIQVLARPIADDWHRRSAHYVEAIKSGRAGIDLFGGAGVWLLRALEALWKPPEQGSPSAPREISERDKTRIAEVEKKSVKLGYQVKIRIAYLGENERTAKLRMQAIVGTFKQFNSTNLNGFKMVNPSYDRDEMTKYTARFFIDRGFILNIEELASVFHLPHTNVETPNIVWASSKTAEPPSKLPVLTGESDHDEQISAFGMTNFRGLNQQFGLYRYDRSRHVYIIGQTGAGKSGLLELFALSDVYHNHGYAIIDPHGDFAVNNMHFIPVHRLKDVVYFNPADTAYPLGFNPMEVTDPNMKSNTSSEIIGVLKRMFGESWGPRLEYILRYTILALLDRPETTMLDITRMLTDKKFRKETLTYCTDTVVLQFWNIEFASWTDKFQAEAIAPVLNKVGAFTANPIIRNIIGQPKSTFNIRQLMDDGKILIVNLSKGLIGEDNAAILGSFLVTKIQLAAMSRSDIPNIEDRRPFYLYVDEFQNFATDSFATILSEARKYGLNLTVANQYISQMGEVVRDAVFGNVGTMISFRVSADDAPILGKQFEPQFEPNDLLQMHNRNFIINMVIKGEKSPAFSATTLTIPPAQTNYLEHIIENSRQIYAKTRSEVESEIQSRVVVAAPAAPQAPPQSASRAKQWPIQGASRPKPAQSSPAPTPKPKQESAQAPEPNKPRIIYENTPPPAQNQESAPAPTPAAAPVQEKAPAASTSTASEDTSAAPKKRTRSRSRSRNRKPAGEGNGNTPSPNNEQKAPATSAPTPRPKQPERDPTELRLR